MSFLYLDAYIVYLTIYRHSLGANIYRIPSALVVKCLSENEALSEFTNTVEDGIAHRVDLVERSRTLDISALDSLPMGELCMWIDFLYALVALILVSIADLRPPSHRWYSVVVGRFPGVYNGP